jgi:hypothetical protein
VHHTEPQLRLPEEIRRATIAFLNWYYNDLHIHQPPLIQTTHAENGEFSYDWRPRHGISRLTLAHIETGLIAAGAFDLSKLGGTDPATAAPPPSLLLTTWFDLCAALEWLSEGAHAALRDQLQERISADTHQFGRPLYG